MTLLIISGGLGIHSLIEPRRTSIEINNLTHIQHWSSNSTYLVAGRLQVRKWRREAFCNASKVSDIRGIVNHEKVREGKARFRDLEKKSGYSLTFSCRHLGALSGHQDE